MKLQCVLLESDGHRPVLKSFRDVESAYKYIVNQSVKHNAHVDLLETVRNDLCDRGQFMVGNFLEVARSTGWTAGVTIQIVSE